MSDSPDIQQTDEATARVLEHANRARRTEVLMAVLPPDVSDTERYRHAVVQVHAVAALLQELDLPKLLAAIDTADTVGPIVDPSLWMKKRGAMGEDKDALTSAYSLWLFGQRMAARRAAG